MKRMPAVLLFVLTGLCVAAQEDQLSERLKFSYNVLARDLFLLNPASIQIHVKDPRTLNASGVGDCIIELVWEGMTFDQQNTFRYVPMAQKNNRYPTLETLNTSVGVDGVKSTNYGDIIRKLTFSDQNNIYRWKSRDLVSARAIETLSVYEPDTELTFEIKETFEFAFNSTVNADLHRFVTGWHRIVSELARTDGLTGDNMGTKVMNWTVTVGGALMATAGIMSLLFPDEEPSDAVETSAGVPAGVLIGGGAGLISMPWIANMSRKSKAKQELARLYDAFAQKHPEILINLE